MVVSFATAVAGVLITSLATPFTVFSSFTAYHTFEQTTASASGQVLAHRGSGRFETMVDAPAPTANV